MPDSTQPVRFIYVEDDVVDVEHFRTVLAQAHITNELIVARNAVEARRYLFADDGFGMPPATTVLLLDLRLPGESGRSFLEDLRALPATARLPVIIFTVSKRDEDLIATFKLKVAEYVTKPVKLEDFLAALGQAGCRTEIVSSPAYFAKTFP